jgi:hypothetical protein
VPALGGTNLRHISDLQLSKAQLGRRPRRQNAKRSLSNSKVNRAIACEFAIELHGDVLFACYAQSLRPKIFDFGNLNVGAEHHVLEVLDDFKIAEPREDDDVQQAVIDDSVFKKRERPSVKPPVTNENKRSLFHRRMFRLDEELRRLPRGDLRCGDEIAERAETAFEREAGLFHHLRVQSDASKLDKISSIGARQIDQPDVCGFDDIPAALEIEHRQAKLHRENVHAAHGEHTQCGIAAGESVCYLADCSVAACRNDPRKSLLDCAPGQPLRFAGMRRDADGAIASERFDALLPAPDVFRAARRRIENDNRISHKEK